MLALLGTRTPRRSGDLWPLNAWARSGRRTWLPGRRKRGPRAQGEPSERRTAVHSHSFLRPTPSSVGFGAPGLSWARWRQLSSAQPRLPERPVPSVPGTGTRDVHYTSKAAAGLPAWPRLVVPWFPYTRAQAQAAAQLHLHGREPIFSQASTLSPSRRCLSAGAGE